MRPRARALEEASGIDADLTPRIRNVASVAHQPADFGRFAVRKYRGEPVVRRLHSSCWEAWYAARKREAAAALKAMGIGSCQRNEGRSQSEGEGEKF
jgi:hypothetical protein